MIALLLKIRRSNFETSNMNDQNFNTNMPANHTIIHARSLPGNHRTNAKILAKATSKRVGEEEEASKIGRQARAFVMEVSWY